MTVDPHLHRYRSLDEIYNLDAVSLQSAPVLADWIFSEIDSPLLIGPDEESEQWVRAVAGIHQLPWRVLRTKRYGDDSVEIHADGLQGLSYLQPVLLDDIASFGATLAAAARSLRDGGFSAPVCVVVHGLFAQGARLALAREGIGRIVCTDSVAVKEAEISLMPLLAKAIPSQMQSS